MVTDIAGESVAEDLEFLYSASGHLSRLSAEDRDPADIFAEIDMLRNDLESATSDIKLAGGSIRRLQQSPLVHGLGSGSLSLEQSLAGTSVKHQSVLADLHSFKAELEEVTATLTAAAQVVGAFKTEEARQRSQSDQQWLHNELKERALAFAGLQEWRDQLHHAVGMEDLSLIAPCPSNSRSHSTSAPRPESRGWGVNNIQLFAPRGAMAGTWAVRSRLRGNRVRAVSNEIEVQTEAGNGGIGRIPRTAVSSDSNDRFWELGVASDTGEQWKNRPQDHDAADAAGQDSVLLHAPGFQVDSGWFSNTLPEFSDLFGTCVSFGSRKSQARNRQVPCL